MPIVGERLRDIRQKRGFSQRELAKRCGLGENALYIYENNKGDPNLDSLMSIANELRVSTDYLLGRSQKPEGQFGDELRPDEYALLTAYNASDSKRLLEIIGGRFNPSSKDE